MSCRPHCVLCSVAPLLFLPYHYFLEIRQYIEHVFVRSHAFRFFESFTLSSRYKNDVGSMYTMYFRPICQREYPLASLVHLLRGLDIVSREPHRPSKGHVVTSRPDQRPICHIGANYCCATANCSPSAPPMCALCALHGAIFKCLHLLSSPVVDVGTMVLWFLCYLVLSSNIPRWRTQLMRPHAGN